MTKATKIKVTQKDIDKVRQRRKTFQKHLPFWYEKSNKLKCKSLELRKFLEDLGFGRFKTTNSRTDKTRLFQNDNGVLRIHDGDSVKRFVHNYIMDIDAKDFNNVFTGENEEETFRRDVVSMWVDVSSEQLSKVYNSLSSYGDSSIESDKDLTLFSDTHKECYIRFLNGIVKITEDNIEFINNEDFNNKNQVWESSIIKKDIKVDLKNTKGMFSEFVNKSMYRQKHESKQVKDWTNEYELNDISKEELLSLRTAYGYMIHDFNTEDESKLVFFIDSMSEMGRAEGGNGKSLVMDSIKYWKKMCTQSGKKMGGAPTQFQFSNVDLDTRFIGIDDITLDFQFDSLFNMISGDMEIERKGVDKFVIESKKKPKMGITSNYVLAGTDTSDTRRQHIVEFGSYWNRLNQEGEKVSDKRHLGGLLFSPTMSNKEWNKFYNYGFLCIQEYLKLGLKASANSTYLTKSIKLQVEGKDGDGSGTEWLMNWITNDRLTNDFHKTGISEEDLFLLFCKDNLELTEDMGGVWDRKFFNSAVFRLVDKTKGWYYNKHCASKGNTKTNRRWLQLDKKTKKQVRFLKITTNDDDKVIKQKELERVLSNTDEATVLEYFKDLDTSAA